MIAMLMLYIAGTVHNILFLAMRSQLTRSVFRRLLSNEGLTFRCPSQASLIQRHRHHASQSLLRPSPRRTLFGFSSKPPREPKDPDLIPGFSKMLNLGVMRNIHARPPPAPEIVAAWRSFYQYKLSRKEPINNLQARHVLKTFQHLQTIREEVEDKGRLNAEDLRRMRKALLLMPNDKTDLHNKLAREIYEMLNDMGPNELDRQGDFTFFVEALTLTGDSMEARDIVCEVVAKKRKEFEREASVEGKVLDGTVTQRKSWQLLFAGFAREDNEVGLLKTFEMAEEIGVVYNTDCQRIFTSFFAARDNVEATKKWYSKPVTSKGRFPTPMPETMAAILQFCIRNDEFEWSKSVFRELLETNPSKANWDIVLQWAAGAMGKGVEDVERMIQVMIRRNQDNESIRPDIDTINGLVNLAISLKDPYLAERYIALGLKSGIQPNAKTFIMQMDYRVDAGDLTGAQAAYDTLQAEEVLYDEDLPAINKYIRALCAAKKDYYNRITSITSDLEERHKRLEADTVAALSMMYLSRDEIPEVTDLLQTQSYHYSLDERYRIRDTFVSFCLDRNTSTARAWDAYTIMRAIFDETSTEIRTSLMNEFFARRRCDMACHVFGHMRQHDMLDRRPVLDTYIQCFLGIASCADSEHLDMVHNMLKMDSAIEPNTKLYNSLILAYTECGNADRALNFWDDITNSSEGPSYRSLEIVFRACGRKPFGDKVARGVWNKMRGMEIDVTPEVFAAYVSALAGQGKWEEARGMVEGCEKDLGIKVDMFL